MPALQDSQNIPCEASCGRFFKTARALNSHLTYSGRCKWYKHGKIRNLRADVDISSTHPESNEPQPNQDDTDWEHYDPRDDDNFHILEPEYHHNFHWEEPDADQPQAGPGPQTAANRIRQKANHVILDDNVDTRITVWTQNAGQVIRKDKPPVLIPTSSTPDTDMRVDVPEDNNHMDVDSDPAPPPTSKFFPFSSELDWKVAQWAVKDGPGHNALDRLLEVPGVRSFAFLSDFDDLTKCRL